MRPFREIIRSPEGVITRGEFRRGALLMLAMTLVAGGLFWWIANLSHEMAWMTVTVAPFFGAILFVVAASLVYFWFCLFVKRMRGMGQPVFGAHGWLLAILAAGTFRLVDYQNRTLGLFTEGMLAHSGSISVLLSFVAGVLFFVLFGAGFLGPDRDAGLGQCFPGREPGKQA